MPDPYLMALWKVADNHRKHSAGKCVDPAPPPAFWMAANANKV